MNGVRDVAEERLVNRMDELGGLPEYEALKFESEDYWPWDEILLQDDMGPDASGTLGGVTVIPHRTIDDWSQNRYNNKTVVIEVVSRNGERRDIIDIPDISPARHTNVSSHGKMIAGRCHGSGGALDVETEHTLMHTRVHCLHLF